MIPQASWNFIHIKARTIVVSPVAHSSFNSFYFKSLGFRVISVPLCLVTQNVSGVTSIPRSYDTTAHSVNSTHQLRYEAGIFHSAFAIFLALHFQNHGNYGICISLRKNFRQSNGTVVRKFIYTQRTIKGHYKHGASNKRSASPRKEPETTKRIPTIIIIIFIYQYYFRYTALQQRSLEQSYFFQMIQFLLYLFYYLLLRRCR